MTPTNVQIAVGTVETSMHDRDSTISSGHGDTERSANDWGTERASRAEIATGLC